MYVVANSAQLQRFRAPRRESDRQRPDRAGHDDVRQPARTAVHEPRRPLRTRRARAGREPAGLRRTERHSRASSRTSARATAKADVFGQTVTGCASNPPPFKPAQSTANSNGNGGASTNFTFNLARNDGEQYVGSSRRCCRLASSARSRSRNAARNRPHPAKRPHAPRPARSAPRRCSRARAASRSRSRGPVYLTGAYHGNPYGLSIKVPAVAGPVQLRHGRDTGRDQRRPDHLAGDRAKARCRTDPQRRPAARPQHQRRGQQARVHDQPDQLRRIRDDLDGRQLHDPRAGGATGSAIAQSPFQVANCDKLKFAPKFKATSNAKTSRTNGAA